MLEQSSSGDGVLTIGWSEVFSIMCVTRKLCIVCFLASYLLSFSPTTSETTRKNENGQMHIHDHDGYQIAEKSKEEIAKLESRYFVTKIFEKYGGANGTLTYDMFENLMLNLGLGKNNSIFKHLTNTTANETNEHHTGHDPHMGNHEHDHEGDHHPKDHKDSHDAHDAKDQKDDHGHQDTEDHQEHHDQQGSHDDHDHQGSHDHQDNQDNHDGHDHQDNHNHEEEHGGHTEIDESLDTTTTVGESKRESDKDKKPENSRKKSTDKKKRKKKKKNKKKNSERKNIQKRAIEHHNDHSLCLSSMELLKTFHYDEKNLIDEESFIYLCPALLFQIETDSCRRDVGKRRPLHDNHDNHDHNHHHHDKKSNSSVIMNTIKDINNIAPKVWGYSTIAVVVISLAGLLGVAVIPIMQKVFYNHLLQFLVALAVGALSGDALLHLLPHAIGGGHSAQGHDDHGHGEGDGGHLKSTYKGLIALTGIFFFFLMERILTIMTDLKRKRKQTKRLKNQTPHKQCQVESDKAVGAKLSTHTDSDYQTCEEMVMIVHPNKALRNLADDTHDSLLHGHHHHHSSSRIPEDDESFHSLKSNSHHGHGHSHTISGDVKSQSIAAIAWMVILGDGIHNFSDGLAIGAAFANSITGGVSTSIAVMCHELPHEIGDFAVLLRAGMNIKQAIMYNCVSSILCFIGMFIGVALGNLNEASLWIFACVGGMFLYIALVDMLPEMTSVETKHGENPYCHLVFQCAGMILGAGIMLIIAVYEPDLLSALDRQ